MRPESKFFSSIFSFFHSYISLYHWKFYISQKIFWSTKFEIYSPINYVFTVRTWQITLFDIFCLFSMISDFLYLNFISPAGESLMQKAGFWNHASVEFILRHQFLQVTWLHNFSMSLGCFLYIWLNYSKIALKQLTIYTDELLRI